MARDAVRNGFTRAARESLIRGGTVVEKSSLMLEGISDRGVDSEVETGG